MGHFGRQLLIYLHLKLNLKVISWCGVAEVSNDVRKWKNNKNQSEHLPIVCTPPMTVHLDSPLNSVTRSREPSGASSLSACSKTFGLSVTVISTAFPRLAISPRTEAWFPVWPLEGGVNIYFEEV